MTRGEIADEMLEARRYVRTQPEFARSRVMQLRRDMSVMGATEIPDALFARLAENLVVGMRFIQVDPEVLEGHLYAAAFELRCKREGRAG